MGFVESLQAMIPMPVSDLVIALITVVLFLPAVVVLSHIVASISSGVSSLFGSKGKKAKTN